MTQRQIREEIARRVALISIAAQQCDFNQNFNLRFCDEDLNTQDVVQMDMATIRNLKVALKELELFINHHLSMPQLTTEGQAEATPVIK